MYWRMKILLMRVCEGDLPFSAVAQRLDWEKRMKWLKKWGYFILLIGGGIVYLSCVDHWQVYAKPLRQLQEWYHEADNGGLFALGSRAEETWVSGEGDISGGSAGSGMGDNAGLSGMDSLPEGSAGNGDGQNPEGDMSAGSNPDGMSGSGNAGSAPGAMDGSGNAGSAPGAMNGSGNAGSAPGAMDGSGNAGSAPGAMDGSGNAGSAPGATGGSGNTGSYPEGTTGSGNTGSRPEGTTGSGNAGSGPGGNGNAENVSGSGNTANRPGGITGSGNEGSPDGAALPEVQYMTVEDDYFSDAVFIGDSRTVGMFEYGGLEEISTFYASTGLTVYKMFESEIASVPGERKKITVEEALQQNSFAKIYLMIGINEMGTGTVESFLEKYQEVVAHLQELQPDAVIYLQAIIKVTAERSAQGDYITNEGIIARNEGIAKLADNRKIFFLDVNPEVCDESGGMIPDYTFDGVHLKAKYIEIWKDYLKSHAISS